MQGLAAASFSVPVGSSDKYGAEVRGYPLILANPFQHDSDCRDNAFKLAIPDHFHDQDCSLPLSSPQPAAGDAVAKIVPCSGLLRYRRRPF